VSLVSLARISALAERTPGLGRSAAPDDAAFDDGDDQQEAEHDPVPVGRE
jgi:hypothetical protein